MRTNIRAVFMLVVSCLVAHGLVDGKTINEYIQISVKVEKASIKAGAQGRLLFSLKPKAGFHVNVEPPISLDLADNKNFTLLTKKFIPDSTIKQFTTKDGYKIFNPSSPVVFDFKIAKSVKPGKHTMLVKLTYYYCSDAEGWCSFTTEAFPVTIMIVAPR